jgi:Ca2+-transporting ATPase
MFHVGNSRSESVSAFRKSPASNPFLLIATASALAVHVGALYFGPTQYVLRVEPPGLEAWVRMIAVASSVIVAVELHKLVRNRVPPRGARSADPVVPQNDP